MANFLAKEDLKTDQFLYLKHLNKQDVNVILEFLRWVNFKQCFTSQE